jgi:phage/plasmid primase-like uncharacterized protein
MSDVWREGSVQFFDTDRNGTWFCRQCSPEGGAGADLVMRFHGLAFCDAAKLIEQQVGALVAYAKPKPTPDPRPRLRKLWADAKPTAQGDIVDTAHTADCGNGRGAP